MGIMGKWNIKWKLIWYTSFWGLGLEGCFRRMAATMRKSRIVKARTPVVVLIMIDVMAMATTAAAVVVAVTAATKVLAVSGWFS